jgi:hypothetical protein
VLRKLARLADIRQALLRGLARLAKGEFGECYVNLASLATTFAKPFTDSPTLANSHF